jgi:uncharacterized protein YjaG (DUF416 family)
MDNNTQPTETATFASLCMNLAAAALAYLGHEVIPGQEKLELNLPLARHSIDTLEMLKTKTAGNLTEEESKLLAEMLYQLQLAYVEGEKGQSRIIQP